MGNMTRIIHTKSFQIEENVYTIIDSGADTSLMGTDFHIVEQDTMRTVEVHGFNDNRGAERGLHIGSGICAVEKDSGTVLLLQVNEGVIMKNGKSLLSSNQLRAYQNEVHDVPRRYGGKQCIILSNGEVLPLNYTRGLCTIKTRLPTEWELKNLNSHPRYKPSNMGPLQHRI